MRDVLEAVQRATDRLVIALEGTDLRSPSELPGWTRLTIACHLRYGAEALRAMTADTLRGQQASYYPEGRATQRPDTLVPRAGETPADVVASLRSASHALSETWDHVDDWSQVIVEPPDNLDLGAVPLARLPLMRLTEVEVHGTDLGLGLPPWSDTLVRHVLPMRLDWLHARRTNHRVVDGSVQGSFLLVAEDAEVDQWIEIDGDRVTSRNRREEDGPADRSISRPGRELLALLLGRWTDESEAVEAFRRAFPGP